MSQHDIMTFLKKDKKRYFTVKEISNNTKIGETSINRGLQKLYLCNLVDKIVCNLQNNFKKRQYVMWRYKNVA